MTFAFWTGSRNSTRAFRLLSTQRPRIRQRHLRWARLRLDLLEDRTLLSPYLVITTSDSGPGSLRDAINQINGDTSHALYASPGNPSVDEIDFAVTAASDTGGGYNSATGVATFTPQSQLPIISNPVLINGYSQPTSHANTNSVATNGLSNDNASRLITLDGTQLGGTFNLGTFATFDQAEAALAAYDGPFGLVISAGNSTVTGLVIQNWGATAFASEGGYTFGSASIGGNIGGGIHLMTSGNDLIQGNFFTKAAGTPGGAIFVDNVPNNTIGGTTPAARNVVGADSDISGTGATGNLVQGNYLGVGLDGNSTLATTSYAPLIINNASYNTVGGTAPGARNIISTFGDQGIAFINSATYNVVQGNYIGLNAAGTTAITGGIDSAQGIWINSGSSNNIIGGTTAAARNIISGWNFDIFLQNYTAGNIIEGNYIGTDWTGHMGLVGPQGNPFGVFIQGLFNSAFQGNIIGGTTPGAGNLISGLADGGNQGAGVVIYGSSGNQVLGNMIGIDANGQPLPNGDTGGVVVWSGTGNAIEGNSIYSNYGLGIDLNGDGVTLNTPGGPHVGPNDLQNFPGISAATFGPATTTVSGTLNSSPNAAFSLDFYASPTADPSGYGQGKYYLGRTTVTTDANGNATFTNVSLTTPSIQDDAIHVITATATDSAGNTSEFSQAFTLNDVTVFGTPGNDSIAVNPGATPGSAVITLNSTVLGTFTPSGQILVFGRGGSDAYTVNFGSTLTTPITVFGNGNDTLTANGSADPNTSNYIIKTSGNPSTITWASASGPPTEVVTYSGIQAPTINGGAGNNYVTDPGSGTTINGGPRQNTIVITATSGNGVVINGGPASSSNNYVITMGSLLGPVTINSTAGTCTVTINGPAGSNTLTLTSTQLTGAGQTINLNLGTTATSLTVDGSAGNDQLVVQGTPPAPVTARHMAPTVGAISAPAAPVAITTTVSASAPFTELDGSTITALWAWGDGTSTNGGVAQTGNTGTVSGSHAYATDGVYTVTVTLTNSSHQTGQAMFQYVVVYNPSAGFVTGGGWITSPSGAYAANPSLTGQANFGLNAKYHNGDTVPTGNTEFQFPAGNLTFHATSYDWLVITTNQAQYQGSGTINGAGNYGFLVTALDGGGHGADLFRLKIWDKNNAVVYDTQPGAPLTATPTTPLGGGRIQVHTNAQLVAGGANPRRGNPGPLTPQELQPVVQEAIGLWRAAGIDAAQVSALSHVAVGIADFPGPWLGMAFPQAIWIDSDAAGYGWYIDSTPADASAVPAALGGPASGQVDLLTVVAHELGHELGFDDTAGGGLMGVFLPTGTRRLPVPDQAAANPGQEGTTLTAIRGELPLVAGALLIGLSDGTAKPTRVTTADQTKGTVPPLPQLPAPSAAAPAPDETQLVEVLDALLAQFRPDPLAAPIPDPLAPATVF